MKKNYDFSEATPNPYASRLQSRLTIRLDPWTLHYFKQQERETGIPHRTLIQLYLRECAMGKRAPKRNWRQIIRSSRKRKGAAD